MRKEWGDFQTPLGLVEQVIAFLQTRGERWQRVLEPTCGVGNFIQGIMRSTLLDSDAEIQGIEIQSSHVEQASQLTSGDHKQSLMLHCADIFKLNLHSDLHWNKRGRLLVIGNPPWVTSAELGTLDSQNSPQKHNIKHLDGLAALTGASNFDLAEAILLKLIAELKDEQPTIALLCKTAVARNVLQFARRRGFSLSNPTIHKINSKQWFHATVDACLFTFDLIPDSLWHEIPVYADLMSAQPQQVMLVEHNGLVADKEAYQASIAIEGKFPFIWRQGIKHDAADIMELRRLASGSLQNKLGEEMILEEEFIYPLLKSSDLFHQKFNGHRHVIVTQHHIGQKTAHLQTQAPLLWAYLEAHLSTFERRKSSIYVGKPKFSIFGIGGYSFAPYKVAVSGLHKTARFSVVLPIQNRPVMLDDTCYFVPCRSLEQALLMEALLNSAICQHFLTATRFEDSKRPITKALLQPINLKAVFDHIEKVELQHILEEMQHRYGFGNSTVSISFPENLAVLLSEGDIQLSF